MLLKFRTFGSPSITCRRAQRSVRRATWTLPNPRSFGCCRGIEALPYHTRAYEPGQEPVDRRLRQVERVFYLSGRQPVREGAIVSSTVMYRSSGLSLDISEVFLIECMSGLVACLGVSGESPDIFRYLHPLQGNYAPVHVFGG